MKLEFGSIRQKVANGAFFYRYQLNGQRKEVPLQTSNKEALRKTKELIPLTRAQTIEFVAVHVNQTRSLEKQAMHLILWIFTPPAQSGQCRSQ